MASYQTPAAKKEEFRKYLDKAGVVDALTKVLVGLYEEPERPPNAVEYVKKVMGAPVGVDVDALRAENEQLRQMVDRLTKENMDLKGKLDSAGSGAPAK